MGYDLRSEQGQTFRWKAGVWEALLTLAERYDWQPEGTQAAEFTEMDGTPIPEYTAVDWPGTYDSNDAQRVTATDAAALAAALERALPDIPDMQTVKRRLGTSAIDTLSGAENKVYIQRFIAFCRAGAFIIC